MKVLFITTECPTNLAENVHGIYKRMSMFIDAIKEIASMNMLFYVSPDDVDISSFTVSEIEYSFYQHWNVKLKISLCEKNMNEGSLSKWQSQSRGVFNFFKQPVFMGTSGSQQIQAFEKCLSYEPDAIFVHRLRSMSPAMLTRRSLPPIFLDLDDVEHLVLMRKIRQPPSKLITLLYNLQVPALWWGEYCAIRLARQTFVCSEQDRNYLTKRWGLPGVVTVPNAVIIPEPQHITSQPTLLLLGSFDYNVPNVNAANFLIEQVWPKIHQVMPEARLIIAGKAPESIRSYKAGVPGVEFTSFVDDLDALYRRVRVVCCPIFSGGGTRVKVVEAAAYGKPIVATRIGVEGLKMHDGQNFLLANTPELFAEACLDLLKEDTLCEQIGANARETALQYYDRNHIVRLIQQYMKI